MSNPSYEPRSYARQPDLFGKYSVMEWKPIPDDASNTTLDQIAAAKRQHILAMAIHEAVMKSATSVRAYAASRHEISYTRFAAVLRGEAVMKLDDIAYAERSLKLTLWNNAELWRGFRP
jgi:hypothetical protein